jgi:hypothetical protein
MFQAFALPGGKTVKALTAIVRMLFVAGNCWLRILVLSGVADEDCLS